jgi:molybdate transport system ATP-binding protein
LAVLRAELRTHVGTIDLDVALEVPNGACLALAGPSGAGKTTVLRLLAGLATPSEGRVECDGDLWLDTSANTNLPPERRRCGYVFQDYALFPHMPAWQNVAYGLRGVPRGERRGRAHELL